MNAERDRHGVLWLNWRGNKADMPEGSFARKFGGNTAPIRTPQVIEDEKKAYRYRVKTGAALAALNFLPLNWIIKDLLPEGLTILAGPLMSRKSFLALDMCLAVARGEPCLGFETTQAGVFYIALDDSERRLKERVTRILGHSDIPGSFTYAMDYPPLTEGFLPRLEHYLSTDEECSLVVVDVFQRLRPNGSSSKLDADEYRELSRLRALADKIGISIVLVHHTGKKADETDDFNRISRSTAILGVPDTTIMITDVKRGNPHATLRITGRDVNDEAWPIRFDDAQCRWVRDIRISDSEQERFENDLLTRFIRQKVDEGDGRYVASTRDIAALLAERDDNTALSIREVGTWLRDNKNNLVSIGICIEKTDLRMTRGWLFKDVDMTPLDEISINSENAVTV